MEKRKRLDIDWYAGVEDVIVYNLPGDHSRRDHSFVIKADKAETSTRLVEKTSAASQISASYDTSTLQTTITITLLKEDTFDLGGGTYYWDHRSVSASDVNDTKVPIRGNFNIEAAIQTPYDGTNLPSSATRYIPIPEAIIDGAVPRRNFSNPNLYDSIFVYEKNEIDSLQTTLQSNINAEATTRESADTSLNTNKVDKAVGKGLSTEDYSTAEKTKLSGIEASAVALSTVKADSQIASAITDDHTHANKAALDLVSGTNTGDQDLSGKVDKIVGKGLSTEDYSTAEKTKLSGIEASAVALSTVKADSQIASAIIDDHTHVNKLLIDNITQNDLTSIIKFNALLDLILNGNYNCEVAPFAIDAAKLTVDINLR
jgi:predicted outer membrane protein